MRRLLCVLPFALLIQTTLHALESAEYQAMRAARPDGRSVAVRNFTLTRDAYAFRFGTGTFHFLAPAAGRTFAAIFIGDGSYELTPASEAERRQLALTTGDSKFKTLTDSFEDLVLLFADDTAAEIEKAGTLTNASPDAQALRVYDRFLNEQKRRYHINLHLRVFQDLLNTPPTKTGVFIAAVDGKKQDAALLVVDPLGIAALSAQFGLLSGEETAFIATDNDNGGIWYLSSSKTTHDRGRGSPPRLLVDATHYEIDTTIASDLDITGTTTIRFTSKAAPFRVLPLRIMPKLRLKRATYTLQGGTAVEAAIVQEGLETGLLARYIHGEVPDADAAVVLPEPHEAGTPAELRIEYEGRNVLFEVGRGSYSVGARSSWYPNVGTFTDVATYALTYRFPKKSELISTGTLVSEKSEGNRKVAEWKSDLPMRVAGFNYGDFEKTSRQDDPSGALINVYTSPDRTKFADDTMADAMNAARVGTIFFGRPLYSSVSVTQQAESSFGQSWPSLIYLPAIALTNSTERIMISGFGPGTYQLNEFAKTVGWHEFAHQWWGHAIGWQSYRDQWLSEGFADFTAALVLQFTEGIEKYDDYWERRRVEILGRAAGSQVAANEAGPISQGFRVATRRSPNAGQAIIYRKGAYVLHMLRMLMRDNTTRNADDKFVAMMHDFAASQTGRNPSTDDFRKNVDRHMSRVMDAAGTGTMDWFFDEWVYGVEVPTFKSSLKAEPAGNGRYRISGTVAQQGVSDSFRSVVPLYADFGGRKETVFIGRVHLTGTKEYEVNIEMGMPKAPQRVIVNAFHDVLARE